MHHRNKQNMIEITSVSSNDVDEYTWLWNVRIIVYKTKTSAVDGMNIIRCRSYCG